MTEKYNYHSTRGKVPFIDFWSMIYLLIVCVFTLLFEQANIVVFGIYLICAIPFFNYPDKFVCICFLLSTMAYFFMGADEGIWSIYTILAVIMVFQLIIKPNTTIRLQPVVLFLWMIFACVLSYNQSRFDYKMGMFAMIYNVVIALLLALTIKFDRDTLISFLPKMATFQLIMYIMMLLINGHYDGYGFSISEKVNHNTFGSSVAILSIIVLVKIVFYAGKSWKYKLFWGRSFLLVFVSGSRNALLATLLTSVLVYIISQKQQGKVIAGGMKFLFGSCIVLFLGGLLLPEIGIDLSRYDYIELIKGGGSNRAIIWETLSPVIWEKHRWFGYGPGHFCSEQMITSLMNLKYSHTHNTIFEAWGELGLFGVICFLLILFSVFKKSLFHAKNRTRYLMIGFLFVEFVLLGLGESFFANIDLWMIIGIILGSSNNMDEAASESCVYGRKEYGRVKE